MARMNEKEMEAINQKMENPEKEVVCPRCGNKLEYKEKAGSCIVSCKTSGCIRGSIRGI